MKSIVVTGSSGLIGSEVCSYFSDRGYVVHGIDNNQRACFLGADADTRWNQRRLETTLPRFQHHENDIRNRESVLQLIASIRPDAIVHAAAQPSHDRAAAIPFEDFDTNAVGTLNLLEAARRSCPESPFVHMSTNKVYGDRPNTIEMTELQSRWDYADPRFEHGVPETFPIDHSTHSLFGASKVASDVMVQEYGRYFGMPTCCLRGGCLTGPNHAGVPLHGFLSYLVKCNCRDIEYCIFGYKGKQVRDNIHAFDVAAFISAFIESPRPGEVYNLGGGKANSCSILEAFNLIEAITGRPQRYRYADTPRIGDHICYYSDLRHAQTHFPHWSISRSLHAILQELAESWSERPSSHRPG